MTECSCRSRVCKVIRRHIYGLYGCDGTVLCRRDALLHLTHFSGEGRLVAHSRRHAAQKRRYLGSRLRETEDVINKEENVLRSICIPAVTERLGEGKARECYRRAGSRRLVHLSEHHRHLRLLQFVVINFGKVPMTLFHALEELLSVSYDSGFDHLAKQVVTLAGTLAHSGKY